MCGITLILDRSLRLDEGPILRMNRSLYHRGPDANGYYHGQTSSYQIYLGNTRLSICDPQERANQPFLSPDQRFILIFNGQIYNYQDLKKQCNTPYAFRTQSDTEVLLYTLAQGILSQTYAKALANLEGMYAFLLWDSQEEKLYYGRDRSCIKPLYVFENENYLIFSSEIQGILNSGLITASLNTRAPHDFLKYRYPQPPHTFYQGIYEVIQGGYLETVKTATRDWAHVNAEDTPGLSPKQLPIRQKPTLEPSKQVELALFESLEKQIPQEVAWGLFLSGGVDSTLILALLQALGKSRIPAFIMSPPPSLATFASRDKQFARQAARQYGAEPIFIELASSDLNRLPGFMDCLDQPWGDPASFLSYLLAEKAAQTTKVCFSGAGADEYFAGYNRHKAFAKYLKWLPYASTFPYLKAIGSLLPEGKKLPARKLFRLIRRFTSGLDRSPQRTFEQFSQLQILPYATHTAQRDPTPDTLLEWALAQDQQGYLPHNVLAFTDRVTMQHSLEVRVPYLDTKLIQLAQSIPATQRLRPQAKGLLKQILNKYGGRAYTQRPKEGFGMPWGFWIKQKEQQWIPEEILSPQSPLLEYVSRSHLQAMVKQHLQSRRDFSHELWALWSLSYFLRQNF